MLGDLGADVIKIEQPLVGDPERGLTRLGRVAATEPGNRDMERKLSYAAVNRSKKCIVVDVTKPKGREIVYRLVPKCDVFLQNFRQGARERAKLDYETLSKYNPKLIYCNVSGYGPEGAESWRRGNDYIGQARSGWMTNVLGPKGEPVTLGKAYVDHMGSIFAAYGILAALLVRERLGIGQEIDTSLLGGTVALQHYRLAYTWFYNQEMLEWNRTEVTNPLNNIYKCQDGKWICFGVLASNIVWPDFCKAAGIQNLEKDPRFEDPDKRAENCQALIDILDKVFVTKTCQEWAQIFDKYHRIMFSPVNGGMDVLNDPQMLDNKYVIEYEQAPFGKMKAAGHPVRFRKTPASVQMPAPEFGQHTEEVLVELGGYSWDEIAQLKEEEVIG